MYWFLTFVFVFCCVFSPAIASGKDITHNDSLLLSQSGYENKVNSANLENAGNENKIKAAVQTFILVSRAKMRNGNAYDEKFLIKKDKLSDNNILYRLKSNELRYQLNKKLRVIKWDNIDFNNFNVTINGNQADASIVENYSYYIDDTFKDTCYENKIYYFTLSLSGSKWYITNIKTSDPWETDDNFVYKDFDVNQAVNDTLAVNITSAVKDKLTADSAVAATSLYNWSYSPSLAINYAKNHFSFATANTTQFGYNYMNGNEPNDCQNFASQCFWAGLGGESKQSSTTRPTVAPVVYDATYGSTNPLIWQHNNYWSSGPYGSGWNWDNVNAFAYRMRQSDPTQAGPKGNIILGDIRFVEAGESL